MNGTINVTVAKTGGEPYNVSFDNGTTLGQALQRLGTLPQFSGSYQKIYTSADGAHIDELIGASGVASDTVLSDGDTIAFISKVDAGR